MPPNNSMTAKVSASPNSTSHIGARLSRPHRLPSGGAGARLKRLDAVADDPALEGAAAFADIGDESDPAAVDDALLDPRAGAAAVGEDPAIEPLIALIELERGAVRSHRQIPTPGDVRRHDP